MKKKLLSLLLACVLCFGCAIGALAGEETAEIEVVTTSDDTDELIDGIPDFEIWAEQLVTGQPELWNEIQTNDTLWAEYGYESREQLLADWNIPLEEYWNEVLWNHYVATFYGEDMFWDETQWIEDVRESMGAPRTGLAVMLNGSFIPFPDAQPELIDGRTMAPLRAMADALGAETTYHAATRQITIVSGEDTLLFTLGDPNLTITRGEESRSVTLDCAPFIRDGRTYVPVRFMAEAFSYDVLWDNTYDVVVLLDRNALISSLDKNFSIINRLLTLSASPDAAYETTSDFDMAIQMLDDATPVTLDLCIIVDGVQNRHAQQATITMDLSQVMPLLQDALDLPPEESLVQSLESVSLEMLFNMDEGTIYFRCPALMQLAVLYLDEAAALDPNAWIALPSELTALFLSNNVSMFSDLLGSNVTVGSYLYAIHASGLSGDDPIYAYENFSAMAEKVEQLLGDKRFAKVGSEYVLRMDRDDYEAIVYGSVPESEEYYDYDKFDILLRVCNLDKAPVLRATFDISDSQTDISGTLSFNATKLLGEITLIQEGSLRLDMEMSAESVVTERIPLGAPPAGSVIMDLNDLMAK